MSNKCKEAESPLVALKNESARQRWELFHRAIAYAKESNNATNDDGESGRGDGKKAGPILSIVR
ncbi:MAG: hypothetical protein GWN47_03650 [Woeseiaceae bacterium]|nr:hypothetical protein [Woeseiaceae bacterium]